MMDMLTTATTHPLTSLALCWPSSLSPPSNPPTPPSSLWVEGRGGGGREEKHGNGARSEIGKKGKEIKKVRREKRRKVR